MVKLTAEQERQLEEYLKTLPQSERETKRREILEQLNSQSIQCPYCLMAEHKIETTKIYEDEKFLAVLEINPTNPGHIVLVPKRHVENYSKLSEEEAESAARILKRISFSISKIYGSLNILISEGPNSGQKFEHLVINIIPRKAEDKVKISWQSESAKPEDLEKVKREIVNNFPRLEEPKPIKIDLDEIEKEFKDLKNKFP